MIRYEKRQGEHVVWYINPSNGKCMCAMCADVDPDTGNSLIDGYEARWSEYPEEQCDVCGTTQSALAFEGTAAIEYFMGCKIF